MEILVVLLVLFVALALAALRWGHDSRDDINSVEWIRHQEWLQAHLTDHD